MNEREAPIERDDVLGNAIGSSWDLITSDPQLQRARKVLSIHELRIIIETTADAVYARAKRKSLADPNDFKQIEEAIGVYGNLRARLACTGRGQSMAAKQWQTTLSLIRQYGQDSATAALTAAKQGVVVDGVEMGLIPTTLLEALNEWSAERTPKDQGEAELMKALWRFHGDRLEPCEGCDGECGETCAPTTAESACANIDAHMERIYAAKDTTK